MATIAELREKYALHMTVERFVSIRELVQDFSEAYGTLEKQLKTVHEKLEAVEVERRVRELKVQQCKLYLEKLVALEADLPRGELMAAGLGETFLALVDRVVVGE